METRLLIDSMYIVYCQSTYYFCLDHHIGTKTVVMFHVINSHVLYDLDPKKAKVIDRFTQAVSSHGLNLVNETKNAHGYAKESIMDFLVPNQANIEAANYFNHRLQKVT